jgi:hypothetical protein
MNTDDGRFTHSYLSSLTWWEFMHFVLKGVEPLYTFLSEVLLRFSMVENEYESLLQGYPTNLRRYLDVIRPRACDIQSNTYVNAGKTDFGS